MDFLKVGFIKKPHGLKGELKVLPLTDNIDRFKKLKIVYLFINGTYIQEELEYSYKKINEVIIKFKKYNNIDEIKNLKSIYIYIDKNMGVKLSIDEYYSQDLIGCIVEYKNTNIGTVENVQNLGSCDLLTINYNKREIFYPLLKKYFNKIDIDNKIIEINQFEGFFD
jgi:16S rRNA processing protein RimM